MFESNIKQLSVVNPNLAENLKKISTEEPLKGLQVLQSDSGHYLVQKNGVVLDDIKNPIIAARGDVFKNIKTNPARNDFIVIFGIGMGYILDEAFTSFKSRIVIYEPDIMLLKFVFDNVDLVNYIASGRVYISSQVEDCLNYIKNRYLTGDKLEITFPKNYLLRYHDELLEFSEKIYKLCRNKLIDVNTIRHLSGGWVTNIITNTAKIKDGLSFFETENKYSGYTALVLGAGPSLKTNIELIKQNKDKFVIFAVNRGLKLLAQEDIVPDFVVVSDAYNVMPTMNTLDNDYLSQLNFIADIKSESCVFDSTKNRMIIYHPENELIISRISDRNKEIKLGKTYGTAAALAVSCACKMGFDNVVCCGIDLAFDNDNVYCDNAGTIREDKVIVYETEKTVTEVKSINGDFVKTREDYASFISNFESICKDFSDKKIYNVTDFGAYIDGMDYKPLQELIPKEPKPDVNKILDEITPMEIDYESTISEEWEKAKEIVNDIELNRLPLTEIMNKVSKSMYLYEYCQFAIMDYIRAEGDEESSEILKKSISEAWDKIKITYINRNSASNFPNKDVVIS